MIPSPRDFNVPHDGWRPNQYESFVWLRENFNNGTQFCILDQPTGGGKSGTVSGLSVDAPILALVSTLGLGRQYEREYNFYFLPGRQEHDCILDSRVEEFGNPTAYDCPFSPMTDCPVSSQCPYLIARDIAIHARKVVLTYKYAALAKWPKDRGGILICDEAHGLAEEVLDLAKFDITHFQMKQFGLPSVTLYFPARIEDVASEKLMRRTIDYIADCWRVTRHFRKDVKGEMVGHRFNQKLEKMLEHGLPASEDWFLDAGPDAMSIWQKGRPRNYPALILRPLDAKGIVRPIWENKDMTVLMSATIGDPGPLCKEVGIDEFAHRVVPHVIPVDKRPVYTVFEERMTKRNLDKRPGLYKAQALAISRWINGLDPEWRGIILTTSYKKIHELRKHLRIGDRLWQPPTRLDKSWVKVTERIQAFLEDDGKGIVACDTIQGWGHGLDLRGDLGRFAVVAGVQHPNPADPYDKARMHKPGGKKYLTWLAHCGSMQACGRVTRGMKVDGEYALNVSAIADGSALTKTAMKCYSAWYKEAMR